MNQEEFMNSMQGAMGGSVMSSAQNVEDIARQTQTQLLQGGVTSEYVTSIQPELTSFITRTEYQQWLPIGAQTLTNQVIFQIRTSDLLHLSDLFLCGDLVLTLENTTSTALPNTNLEALDKSLLERLFSQVECKFGMGQEQRNKTNQLHTAVKISEMLSLDSNTYRLDKQPKYLDFSAETDLNSTFVYNVPAKNVSVFSEPVSIPLHTIEHSGLLGVDKVYPPNCLITITLTLQQDIKKVFKRFSATSSDVTPPGISLKFELQHLKVIGRVTTVSQDALRQTDQLSIAQAAENLTQMGSNITNVNPANITDPVYMNAILKNMNASATGPILSVLSTPTSHYLTHELVSTSWPLAGYHCGITDYTTVAYNIQSTLILPKALFFWFEASSPEQQPIPINTLKSGVIKDYNVLIDSKRCLQYKNDNIAVMFALTKHALGRQHTGVLNYQYNTFPAIIGLPINQAGDLDYTCVPRSGLINIECTIKPSLVYNAVAPYDNPSAGGGVDPSKCMINLHVVRVFDQIINIDTQGQVVFVNNNA